MRFRIENSVLSGGVTIPGSKSHTIRGLIIGTLAGAESVLRLPLDSSDTRSCVRTCRMLGGRIALDDPEVWRIVGTGGNPHAAPHPIDVGNSGTTLFLAMTAAALGEALTEFTGDEQIRRRSAGPLLAALRELGAHAESLSGNGCAPLRVGGRLHGGQTTIECPTSQYLSSLLIGCPLAPEDTLVEVPLLHEKPYVRMTMAWLDAVGAEYDADDSLSSIEIPGGQRYAAFDRHVPADFSSATFPLVAAAVTGSRLFLRGLDMDDVQGDKAVVGMLSEMGCEVDVEADGLWIMGPERLEAGTFDLNATPDALPAMAVAGAAAEGETRLVNVPQARIKETDRIAVTAAELAKMGADVGELEDGLIVRGGKLKGAELNGHGDHRMVMALSVAGLVAEGATTVDTAECVEVTFPGFVDLMRRAGASITVEY